MKELVDFLLRKDKKESISERAGDIYVYKSKTAITAILITTFGVNPDFLEEIIVTTKRKLSRKNDRVIYITDSSDFGVFRRHAAMFEYLPSLKEQHLHAADMPWQAYLQERWSLILAKWRPHRVLAYGKRIDIFISEAPAHTVLGAPDMPKP